jgi:hypothetical protein
MRHGATPCLIGVATRRTPGTGLASAAVDIRSEADPAPAAQRSVRHCGWCGRRVPSAGQGRPRQYCAQSCRQRAYERRAAVQRGGLPGDAVVLSAVELADLQDRLFRLRCAAEDVATAVEDGADNLELRELAVRVAETAGDLERIR